MQSELTTEAERRAALAQNYPAFASLSLLFVRSEVAEALSQFGKFGLLEEYTKHDMSHIDSMLKMYDWLIPASTAARMTAADWLLLTLATYLHDFGLIVTRDEFDKRHDVEGYVQFVSKVRDYEDPAYLDYRAQLDAMPDADVDRFLYQEFVRAKHASRIRSWLRDSPDPTLGYDPRIVAALRKIFGGIEETFLEDLGLVCESHHADDLENTSKYRIDKPYGQDPQEEANVQYAAFLVRSADLLDITQSRVPSMAALIINPRNPKSQLEWAKQAAVRRIRPQRIVPEEGEASDAPDVIEVHAQFKDSEGFFGLTQYLKYASEQLAVTHRWATSSPARESLGYEFPWRKIDTSHVVAKGFVAEPFEFTIDQGKILDLLTGHTLYNDSGVVVRELLQNALDAVRLQAYIDPDSDYRQEIAVTWDSRERVLTVADNGTGMTQSVIEGNFLRVGSSRYQEPEFRKSHPDFTPISRFGIGVLSAFMVADDVEVITVNQHESEARQLTLRDVHGQYLVRLLDKLSSDVPLLSRKHGTSVRLKLRSSARNLNVEEVLRYWCLLPGCSVTLSVDGAAPETVGFDSMKAALEHALVSASAIRAVDGRLSTHFGDTVEIREEAIEGCTVAFAVSWNQWLQEWQFLRVDPERQQSRPVNLTLGTAIGGVRVTESAPGFSAGAGLAAMANVLGKDAPRTNVARSAMERTDDYDRYLDRVYGVYVRHVNEEMVSLEAERNNSPTRAATEGSYLVGDIASVRSLESEPRFRESVRHLPFIVVEEKAHRERRSLSDLETLDSVWTVEGSSVQSFERVLGTIRGSSPMSLTSLTAALGVTESLRLPEGPLICGLPSGYAYGGRLFASAWDPVRFETDDESRVLRAKWTKNTGHSGWTAVRTPTDLPSSVGDRLDLVDRLRHDRSMEIYVPVGVEVFSDGIDEDVIKCQGRHYVVPGSPLLDIKAASDQTPEDHRLWAIAFLIINLLSASTSGADRAMRVFGRVGQDAGTRKALLRNVKNLAIYKILDQASVMEAFMAPSAKVLDVSRWDRRSASSD